MKQKFRKVIRLAGPLVLLLYVVHLTANNYFNVPRIAATGITDTAGKTIGSSHRYITDRNGGFSDITVKKLISIAGGVVQLRGAKLDIPSLSLKFPKEISISALRKEDLPPIGPELVNVTAYSSGYRFLPHGTHFENDVNVSLSYDEKLIPEGYTANDIITYYFDEMSGHWTALDKALIDQPSKQIISRTTHFTDMINGVILVPESPQSLNYNPTTIKDIEAANPSSEITTIAPPNATNMGNVLLQFPLKIPAGRLGLHPELAIHYNSESNNGWLGVGWDLITPAITVETRWGVPRYDNVKETETYLLNGAQLSPVAHRGILKDRSNEKQFFPRVQKDFDKIVRHGSDPSTYWWEVIEKNGTRYFYGGKPGKGFDANFILATPSGKIAHWALAEVRDLNDNFVSYHYNKVIDAGIPGGTVPGYQLYIAKITYTGHGSQEGKYSIVFKTSRDLNEKSRSDVIINARSGFKQVTSDLLRKVEVQFNNNRVRSYELNYHEGPFFKTLLDDIVEFDASGQEFYRHRLNYYDNVTAQGTYHPLDIRKTWESPSDNIQGTFLNPIDQFGDHGSALSGNKSLGGGASFTVTAGLYDGKLYSKEMTAGGSFGFSIAGSEGLLQLIDINGDALPDKVFKKDGKLSYRPNVSGPDGQLRFGDLSPITGANDFDIGRATTLEGGIESNFVVYAGLQFSQITNERSTYFTDVNGDQLTDIVHQGTVYFNHLNGDGHPVFTATSSATPSPIQSIASMDPALYSIDSAEIKKQENDYPLHDVVKIWKAPDSGVIRITNPVQLIQNTSEERRAYQSADGVKVSIQHRTAVLWNTQISATDYSAKFPTGVDSIRVEAGDQIYFRVQSVYDGAYDQVNWEPMITYRKHRPGLNDANGFPVYQFNASTDFLPTVAMSTGLPFKGTIQIKGLFDKPQTSDGIKAEIIKKDIFGNEHTLWQNELAWNSLFSDSTNLINSVVKGEELYFRVHASTNIDWAALKWAPRVYYISSDDTLVPQVYNRRGEPLFNFHPLIDHSIYNKTIHPPLAWIATQADTISILPKLQFLPFMNERGSITFSVKKHKELVRKETISITPSLINPIITGADSLKVIVKPGDTLFIEYHTRNEKLWKTLVSATAQIISDSTINMTPAALIYSVGTGSRTIYNEGKYQFGAMYRNWGQFVYNGNRELGSQPIDESELVISSSLTEPEEINLHFKDTLTADDAPRMQDTYNSKNGNKPSKDRFIYMIPSAKDVAWKGYDDSTYISSTIFSSSRMGKDDLRSVNPLHPTPVGSGASGITKVSVTQNVNVTAAFFVGVSYSGGNTSQLYEYIDMNGDHYPDILSKDKIQYTLPTGGLDASAKEIQFGQVGQTSHNAFGVSLGGTFLSSSAANAKSKNKGAKSNNAGENAGASASLSGGLNVNVDNTPVAWLDINGDGLPDRVYNNGEVELNLGYSFTAKEKWGFNGINDGNTLAYSAGIGINLFFHSISAGISLSRGENHLNVSLRDMNGDGLPDYVLGNPPVLDIVSPPTTIKVALNTGNGFAAPVDWPGATRISKDVSTGESVNAAFCICIPIIPIAPVAKICFNPSIEFQQGANRETISILDINGDNNPDFLESEKDDDLNIRLSTIKLTNLLKSVMRPMGGGFVVNYKRIGNTYAMPNSVWAMDTVKLFDGLAGDSPDTLVTSFEYKDGFYNRNEREFYGFKVVKTNVHDRASGNFVYRTTTETFGNTHYYERNLLLSESLQDSSGKLFNETKHKYEFRNIQTGSLLPPGFESSDAGAAFPALAETKTFVYEGQPTFRKSTGIQYSYDLLGNIISYVDLGDTDPADDYATQITYHSVPQKYLMSTAKSIVVSSGGQTFRKREQDISSQNGDVTEVRSYSEAGIASVTNMEYDTYGNLVTIMRPRNEATQRLSYHYEYDPDVNTYVIKVSDSYGYFSSTTYDLRFGIPLSTTDINNQKTVYTIDNAGRISTIQGPMEAAAGVPFTVAFDYHPHAQVPWARSRHYDPGHPDNFIETALFLDGLQRVVQVKKDIAIFNSANGPDTEVMQVSGANVFDAFGRKVETYFPITEPKGNIGTYNKGRDAITPTRISYDVLDRQLKVTRPDETFSLNQYGFANDRNGAIQLSTLMTDANGKVKEVFTDVRGRTTSTKNYFSQGGDVWSSFRYNPINELIAVQDDQHNKIAFEHDWLGRRTKMIHPDAGLTTFQYDPAGQLIKKITANLQGTGKSINYNYDRERLKGISYPENPRNNVSYTYGEMNAPFNRTGRVVLQEDATGAQEFFYDELGEVVKNIRSIIIPFKGVLTYKTEWKYDTWNRLQSIIYPDGEILVYDYNAGGRLSAMHGQKAGAIYDYVEQTGYDKFEEKIYLRYENGTETFFERETKRRRLKQLVTETAKDRKIINIAYTYDNESNITSMNNATEIPGSNLMGGSAIYNYSYDDLYRLTKASGNFKGSTHEQRYEVNMVYNSIGNILQKSQAHDRKANNSPHWVPQKPTTYSSVYAYGTTQPHEPIRIGSQVYSYDLNGNQKGWTTSPSAQRRTINWDEENRMSSLADNGALSSYIYDADGDRILKNHGGGEAVKVNGQSSGANVGIGNYTVYVDPYTEVRSGSYTKHYYADAIRIASKLELGGDIPMVVASAGRSANKTINYHLKEEEAKKAVLKLYKDADIELSLAEFKDQKQSEVKEVKGNGNNPGIFMFYYHPDHVGSTAYITDASGEVFQHLEYFPFGETFVEEHSNTNRTPYLFNAKELDDKTGLYYYGARYYDPKTSVWQSVDPLAEKYPAISPYSFVANNPLTYRDPDGKEITIASKLVDGRRVTTITVKAKLINNTDNLYSAAKMRSYANRIKTSIQEKYSGRSDNPNESWSTLVTLTVANKESTIKEDDHVFRIVPRGQIPGSERPTVLGKALFGQNVIYLADHILDDGQKLERTGAHEFGHSAQLRHPQPGTMDNNLMHQTKQPNKGDRIEQGQIKRMRSASRNDELNQGDQGRKRARLEEQH